MLLSRSNSKRIFNLILAGILLATLSLAALPHIVSASSTTIQVDPSTSTVTVGQTFNVNINITDVTNLTAWEFKLYYLNTVLNCTTITEGAFLKTGGGTYFVKTINNSYNSTHGRLLAGCSLLGIISVSGNGTLATITFKAKAEGNTPLHLDETKLGDEKIPPQPIPHTTTDGTVAVRLFRTLMVTTTSNGTTDPPPGEYTFLNGTLATIEAIPDSGFILNHWELNSSNIGATNPLSITMNASYTLHAVFSTEAVHDVAAIDKITFSSKHGPVGSPYTPVTECYPTWTVEINVTVQNQGTATETFTVKVFYGNATGNYTIGISPASYSVTLAPGASTTKTFAWDVPDIPKVVCTKFFTYTIYANASVVPGETDTADNIRDGVVVKVKWYGDGNGDGLVGLPDLMILSMSYKKSPGDPGYNPQADFSGDGGQIGLPDLMILSMNYRKGPCDP